MSPVSARAIASFSDSLAVASVRPSFASLPLMASAKYSAAAAPIATATAKPIAINTFFMSYPFTTYSTAVRFNHRTNRNVAGL